MDDHSTILGRRDVALVPCYALVVISAAASLSAALRPDPSAVDSLAVVLGLVMAASCGALGFFVDTPLARRMRGKASTYLLGTVGVVVGLVGLALADGGLASPYFYGIVLAAAYLGLVLPLSSSAPAMVGLVIAAGGVHVAVPDAEPTAAVSLIVILVAGWFLGRLGRLGHTRAARIALTLSRSDSLTRMLNRRGFFEEFTYQLDIANQAGKPLGLLLLDLDNFKPINDTYGHSAGDEILRWVGEELSTLAPSGAAVGRMGGDEFALTAPGATPEQVDALATLITERIGVRIGVSVGIATHLPGEPESDVDELVRTADAALYVVKRGPGSGAGRGGPIARVPSLSRPSQRRHRPPAPPLTYADYRARPDVEDGNDAALQSSVFTLGFLTIAIGGALIFTAQVLTGDPSPALDLLKWIAAPWVLTSLGFSAFFYRRDASRPLPMVAVTYAPTFLLGSAICMVVVADDGLANPVVLALALKVMYDAFALPRHRALQTMAIVLCWWLAAALLGPSDSLWVAPFQLAIIGSTFALGFVANRAFAEATQSVLDLAHTDPLTGLQNRAGFDAAAKAALGSALRGGPPFALLVFDLDDFKAVNDTLGHAAGDDLLRRVAATSLETLDRDATIARIGGDEFAVVLSDQRRTLVPAVANELTRALAPHRAASVGFAVQGDDGTDVETLLKTADQRAYAIKRGRSPQPVTPRPTADFPC